MFVAFVYWFAGTLDFALAALFVELDLDRGQNFAGPLAFFRCA